MIDRLASTPRTETRAWVQNGFLWLMILVSAAMLLEALIERDPGTVTRALGTLLTMTWLRLNLWFGREAMHWTNDASLDDFRWNGLVCTGAACMLLSLWPL